MIRTSFSVCLAAFCLGCGRPAPETPGSPDGFTGLFADDYGIEYSVTPDLWLQRPSTRYHVVEWNPEGKYLLAQNGADNPSEAGLWTRIDWVALEDSEFEWAFCYAVYDAGSLEEARAAPDSQRETPRIGCNGFPFSRMKRIPTEGANAPEGWAISHPAAEGLDPDLLSQAVAFIEEDEHDDFRSLVVARNGKLVAEHYFHGHGPDSLQDMRSAGKSVTSALVGIAIAEGLIQGVDAPVLPLFPSYAPVLHDRAGKQAITMAHLLTMTSGLHADADDPSSPGYEDHMWESEDWVRFVLDLPMSHEPGSAWMYSSASSFLAGAAVEEASGQSLATYAEERLFGPLGIDRYRWLQTPNGRTVGQGNLSLRARDMAKLGQVYLDGGLWNGQRVLPEAWVRASVEPLYPVPWENYDGYGYSWYTHTLTIGDKPFPYFLASGNGGNKIYAFPEQRLVVVTQSAAYNTRYGHSRSLEVLRRVLAAVE
ncbi:MAG: serine hydrolase [Rhodothermales bacterium]|nr:serine hydrolase [Rhodothermales bacterium]MBO6780852.1 serine hydrolase [Rhodothermales bacterium]